MTRTCQWCAKTFVITSADRTFYERIDVSEPLYCPDCRLQRRLSFRNDRTFYQRTCDLTKEPFISIYPPLTTFPVYKPSAWYGDGWDPLRFGRPVDFTRSFFQQWYELMQSVPRLGIDIVNCENSDYCNYCGDDKNCYLDIAGEANEDCYYNLFTKYSRNCADCTFIYHSEFCYESISCYNCHSVKYSIYLDDCFDCAFCYDCRGCHDCLFSCNLRQKEYQIFNRQYSMEEYQKAVTRLQLNTAHGWQRAREQFQELLQKKAIRRLAYMQRCEECTGDDMKNCKNVQYGFNVTNCENSKYLYDVLDAKECYDLNYSLYDPELSYELISTLNMRYSAFNMASHYCYNVYYGDQCNNSSDLFGCIGLNKKKYCILNTQYSATEYQRLKDKLIEHMKKTGEWGEFFPIALSPFAYNETVAQEYFPFTEEEAKERGFRWKKSKQISHQPQTVSVSEAIEDVRNTIVREIFLCLECGKNFKIINAELELYRRIHVPIPRRCPQCRHLARMKLRNPRCLWQRQCMCEHSGHGHAGRCPEEFETTYSPERPERIYCQECYQKEVY